MIAFCSAWVCHSSINVVQVVLFPEILYRDGNPGINGCHGKVQCGFPRQQSRHPQYFNVLGLIPSENCDIHSV